MIRALAKILENFENVQKLSIFFETSKNASKCSLLSIKKSTKQHLLFLEKKSSGKISFFSDPKSLETLDKKTSKKVWGEEEAG